MNADADLSGYKLVVAPMLYMLRPGVAERLSAFVEGGGTLVGTYFSGYVDENDLIFEHGFLGPLRDLFGITVEEIDARYPQQTVDVVIGYNELGLDGIFQANTFCERIHTTTAEVLAEYAGVWYSSEPAITLNRVGNGQAIYVASRNDAVFTSSLLHRLVIQLDIDSATPFNLPEGVSATKRTTEKGEFLFILNTTVETHWLPLPGTYREVLNNQVISESLELGPYGVAVLSVHV